MELRPFTRYAGSKWRTAKKYPKPAHAKIVEPFAGGAGYSLRYADLDITLVDADERICGVWDFLINASPQDILDLPILEQGQHVDDTGLDSARKWLIGYNINVAASPRKTATRWTHLWDASRRSLFSEQVKYIKHWKVVHGSYVDAPTDSATYFIDPPYQQKSFYREKVPDYSALATWVKSLSGQVIVCEGQGADWLPFEKLFDATAHCNASKSHGSMPELVWVNSFASAER